MSAVTVAFAGALVYSCPVLRSVLQEHLNDQEGQVLPHLFLADVERWLETEALGRRGQARSEIDSILAFLESALELGDEEIAEVIHASFLEHLPRPGQPASELRTMVGPLLAQRLREIG